MWACSIGPGLNLERTHSKLERLLLRVDGGERSQEDKTGWGDADSSGSNYFPNGTQVQCFHALPVTQQPRAYLLPSSHGFTLSRGRTLSSTFISSHGFLHHLNEPTLEEHRVGMKVNETHSTLKELSEHGLPRLFLHPVKSSLTALYC